MTDPLSAEEALRSRERTLHDRLFAILDEARITGWTEAKAAEVQELAAEWQKLFPDDRIFDQAEPNTK